MGHSPWGHRESDTTERLNHLVFSWAGSEAKCAPAKLWCHDTPKAPAFSSTHVLWLYLQFRQLGHLIMSLLHSPTVRTAIIPHLGHCHSLLMGPRRLPSLVSLDSA